MKWAFFLPLAVYHVLLSCTAVVYADFAEEVQKASSAPSGSGSGINNNNNQPTSPRSRLDDIMGGGTLAGSSFLPFVKRLILPKDEFNALMESIGKAVHWEDMLLMALIGWLTVPSIKFPYQNLPVLKLQETPFQSTLMYLVADHLQQIARISLLVYFVDILKMICIGVGFDFCKMSHFPHAFAQIAYTLWITERIATAKKLALRKSVSKHPETFGRMQIINRLGNAALIGACGFIILNIMKVEMGVAMHSFLALGSISSLAVALASQGIFSQILNGLLLVSSDRIYEGDYVKWSNGLSGTIVKLGWMETIIRGPDETMVSVPNNDLVRQQVSNLSRVNLSQVEQTLRFKIKDADDMPTVVESIKSEIKKASPHIITDGSRPFRVVWSDYGVDFLQVNVDVHLRVRPIGDEYWTNRQRILQAIRKAVKRHDLTFAKE